MLPKRLYFLGRYHIHGSHQNPSWHFRLWFRDSRFWCRKNKSIIILLLAPRRQRKSYCRDGKDVERSPWWRNVSHRSLKSKTADLYLKNKGNWGFNSIASCDARLSTKSISPINDTTTMRNQTVNRTWFTFSFDWHRLGNLFVSRSRRNDHRIVRRTLHRHRIRPSRQRQRHERNQEKQESDLSTTCWCKALTERRV